MKITYYGHSCFGVSLRDQHLLFDPFIKPNQLAKNVEVSAIPADFIFVSHGHSDHTSEVEEIAGRTGAAIVSNFEIVSWYQNKGFKNIHPMNHGGKWKFPFGTAKYVFAAHSSSMHDGAYGGNPGGFVIESGEGNFYYSGDTALTMDMQLIPMTSAKLSAALFPIGDNFTMGIDEAIIASDFVKCDRIIGLHYDTFGYIKINHEEAVRKFKDRGKELLLLNIGSSTEI